MNATTKKIEWTSMEETLPPTGYRSTPLTVNVGWWRASINARTYAVRQQQPSYGPFRADHKNDGRWFCHVHSRRCWNIVKSIGTKSFATREEAQAAIEAIA